MKRRTQKKRLARRRDAVRHRLIRLLGSHHRWMNLVRLRAAMVRLARVMPIAQHFAMMSGRFAVEAARSGKKYLS